MTEWSNIRVPLALKTEIENHIKKHPRYNSLSDFVKQTCREKLDLEDRNKIITEGIRKIIREEIKTLLEEKKIYGRNESLKNVELFFHSFDPSDNLYKKIMGSIELGHYLSIEEFLEKAVRRQLSYDEEFRKGAHLKIKNEIKKDVFGND